MQRAHGGRAGWRVVVIAWVVAIGACSGELSETGGGSGTGGGGAGAGGSGAGAGGNGAAGAGGEFLGSAGSDGGGATGGQGSGGTGGSPPSGTVPMFVAQGHAGRTIVSCDQGRTWVADQSDEGWNFCTPENYGACDHGPGAARGLTWGGGWFFATFGWGEPGAVERSRDGIAWEPVHEGRTFGGLAFGNGRLVAADRLGEYSDDHGVAWNDFASVDLDGWNVRSTAFVPYDGGRFIMSADGEVVVSSDGSTWVKPLSIPEGCSGGAYPGRIIYGNGTIVMTAESGVVCSSDDGGQSWSATTLPTGLRSNGVWTGSEFMAWNFGTAYRSADGRNWTSSETVPSDIDFGVAAISEQGSIVAVSSGWEQHYDEQAFYRSDDGVNWETLSGDAYTGGHPITVITFGYAQPSDDCPL